MEEFVISERRGGRPDLWDSEEERECYELLERLKIPFEYVSYSHPPISEEEVRMLEKAIGTDSVKNLVFSTRNRKKIFFFILPASSRFNLKKFRSDFQVSKLHLLDDSLLQEILHTRNGAVSIFELQYDSENRIQLFIDERILKQPYFRLHPDTDTVLLRISVKDLQQKLLPELHHPLHVLSSEYFCEAAD